MTAHEPSTDSSATSLPRPGALPRVAVVVVTYNSADIIADCLRSLAAACSAVELVSVVVVDNASRDDSVRAARQALPGIEVAETGHNLGYAAAINHGRALLPDHETLLILNPDATLHPGSVRALADAALAKGHGLSVPRMESVDGALSLSIRRPPSIRTALSEAVLGGRLAGRLGWGEMVADPGRYLSGGRVAWATGAAVMVTRDCWDEVGEWDASFFLYSEETEYMQRAGDHGWTVWFEPAAVCRHRGGASGSSDQLWALLIENKVRLYGRSHGTTSTAVFRAALLLGECVRAACGSGRSRVAARSLLGRLGPQGSLPSLR